MTIRRITHCLTASLLLASSVTVTAAPLEISARGIIAAWQDGVLSLKRSGDQQPFLTHSTPDSPSAAKARIDSITDPVWGNGRAIVIEMPSGDRLQVALFASLPFSVWQRTLVNPDATERVVNKDLMLDATLDLGQPPEQLKTISTAGLLDLAGHPGGYTFMAVGDPQTRRGVVCGWLTHERGSGVVFSDVVEQQAVVRARIDYGDLRIEANQAAVTEVLVVGCFDDVRIGLEDYGDAIAQGLGIQLPDQPCVYCTWYHGGASNERQIARNTDFVRERLVPYGFHVMQIDDKWQAGQSKNGPKKDFSRAGADGPYPSGMKKTADYITDQGLIPGIWFMPFAGTWNDPCWADRLDLFYKEGRSKFNHISETNGAIRPDFPPGEAPFVARWGGTCLDMTNPKTQAYLRSIVARIAHDWGYKYFKMDGLWTGTGTRLQYVNSSYQDDDLGQTTRFNPQLTPIEAYATGLDLVRETAGKDVFLLGCCAPQNMRSFGPAFGRVDAMRVGPDNGANPNGLIRGPLFATRVFFLNKRVWYNDPDPVYVRSSFPEPMAQTSVSWTALTGSLHSSSYSYYELPPERLNVLLRSLPSHGLKTVRPVDYLEQDPARIWLLTDDRDPVRKDVIGLFNWDIGQPVKIECTADRIGLPAADRYVGFDFWANRFVPPFSKTVAVDLAPGGCCILSVRAATDYPQVVSTSRHLTQGIVDLRNEGWDKASGTLSGVSQIVGGDAYELRIIVPVGKKSWLLKDVQVAGAPSDTEVTFVQTGPTIRLRIACPASSEVTWSARFESGEVVVETPQAVTGLKATIDLEQVDLVWDPCRAHGYRVLRDGTPVTNSNAESYRDGTVKLGQAYVYAVQARSWDGRWTKPTEISVTMPAALQIPDSPPLPQVYCSDLKPAKATTGWGQLGIDQACSQQPLVIEGKTYEKGIGAHANSTLVYRIPQGASRFVATVGLDDGKRTDERSSVVFQVVGDMRETGAPPAVLARSPKLTSGGQRIWHFDIPLDPRLRDLHLIVEDAGDGIAADHADWANAGFVVKQP